MAVLVHGAGEHAATLRCKPVWPAMYVWAYVGKSLSKV